MNGLTSDRKRKPAGAILEYVSWSMSLRGLHFLSRLCVPPWAVAPLEGGDRC